MNSYNSIVRHRVFLLPKSTMWCRMCVCILLATGLCGDKIFAAGSLIRGRVGHMNGFGPAFSADPGSFSSYSSPLSEIDGSVNTECPYPPCRQLRKDLISSQENQRKRAQLVKEDPKATKFTHMSETEFDDHLKPSPLNKVQGGRDCLVCEEILLGEGINPRNPDVMDAKIKSYSDIVENKLLKQKPHDDVLKKHLKNVHLCGKAFSDHRCTIVGKVKTVEPIAPLPKVTSEEDSG